MVTGWLRAEAIKMALAPTDLGLEQRTTVVWYQSPEVQADKSEGTKGTDDPMTENGRP